MATQEELGQGVDELQSNMTIHIRQSDEMLSTGLSDCVLRYHV